MKALVIGGNRFFGKRLVSLLLEDQFEVTLMNRGQSTDDFGQRVQRIVLDRARLTRDHVALRGKTFDIVYDQVCFDANEAATACDVFSGRIGHYIFTSTQSVYGRGTSLVESAFDPKSYKFSQLVDRNSDYGEAKRQAEATFFQRNAFPVSALRIPFVLGEDDYTGRLQFHVDHVAKSEPIFFPDINARVSFIDSADAAKALRFLAAQTATGPINCCSPEEISLREMLNLVEKAVGHPARIASVEQEGDHSPYGVASDGFMNIDKMRGLGFSARPLNAWLPQLIHKLASKIA